MVQRKDGADNESMMKSGLATTATKLSAGGFLKCMAWAGTGAALCVLPGRGPSRTLRGRGRKAR